MDGKDIIKVIAEFNQEVYSKLTVLNPETDWHDLCLGWCLGKGMKSLDARIVAWEFSLTRNVRN